MPEAKAPLSVATEGPLIEGFVFVSKDGPVNPDAVYELPSAPRRATLLTLRSLETGTKQARLSCDASARLLIDGTSKYIRPGGYQFFDLPGRFSGEAKLELTPEVSRCTLRWGGNRRLEMVRNDLVDPAQHELDTRRESCRMPASGAGDKYSRLFYAHDSLDRTCAMPSGPVDFALEPLEGFQARAEALIGGRLDPDVLLSGNPDMPIDFSRAPKLDLIVLSYLHIRADFSGHLTRRMIEYHAARGTRVRILTSAILMLDLDRSYWESLAARHPNVQLQYFEWSRQGLNRPGDLVDILQRSNHTKVFLALSPEAGNSRFIIGGRNLHDGFFFNDTYDVSSHPELRNYESGGADGLGWHTIYYDFEIVMRSDAVVQQVASHFSRLWHRDADGAVMRPMTEPGRVAPLPTDGVAWHFISMPWADGQAMDDVYVKMIDAAEREIFAASPFLYPTPAIEAALVRAAARGVRVVLVSRINSTDPPGFFTTAMNHAFLNRHTGGFELWNYEPEGHLMHTKLLIVDGRLSVVTSTNLNARSFLHDSENGVVFLDRAMSERLKGIIAIYIRDGEPITEEVPSSGLMRAIGGIRWIWQYF